MGMIEDLNPMSGRQLGELMAAGHPIDLDQLADREYRGISLGIPGWVEKLAWKTFKKVFHREPETGKLRGWNVRMQQTGLHGECIPIDRKGQPKTFGHYEVVPRDATHRPTRPCEHAAFIDYRLGGNSVFDPMRFVIDPIVALEAGSAEHLLGWSYVDLGWARFSTPAYFLLVRDVALTHVHAPPALPAAR